MFHKSYKEVSEIVDVNMATVLSESTLFKQSKDSMDEPSSTTGIVVKPMYTGKDIHNVPQTTSNT